MAYRHRLVMTAKYGKFNEVTQCLHQVNEICAARGWIVGRVFTPFVGTNNEIIMETDYPDLATFERETDEFYGDAEAMKIWRAGADFVIEGSGRDELLTDAPLLA